MRTVLAIAFLSLTSACVEQTDSPPAPSAPPAPVAEAPAQSPAPPASPEEIKTAQEVVAKLAQNYKDAKAITDTLRLKFDVTGMPENPEEEITVTVGSGNDAMLAVQGFRLIAVDGKVNFVADNIPDKYFAAPLENDLGQTLVKMFGDSMPPPPHLIFRREVSPQQQINALTLGVMRDVQVSGYQLNKPEDGSPMHEVKFASMNGKGSAFITTDSHLLRKVQMEFEPQPGMNVKATITMDPKLTEALPTPIAFAPGERKLVESIDQLVPTPIAVGEVAPDFTLTTLEGESVTLSELKGSVVVLDFWATWCMPCRRGLPMLQQFADWAKSAETPVKVYAVNVWERTKAADQRKNMVSEFWKNAKFTMPTLLDLDDSVISRYGFGGVPTTVVIGPTGKVAAVHNGVLTDMVEQLKKEVEEAAKSAG